MYVCIYLSVCAGIYLNSLITHVNTHTNPQTLLYVLRGFLTNYLARTVIWLLTHSFKNHSVTDWKSRRRMLQIGLLLSEIPWVCLSCRDLHRPFKFVIRAVWNKKWGSVRDAKQKGNLCELVQNLALTAQSQVSNAGPRAYYFGHSLLRHWTM